MLQNINIVTIITAQGNVRKEIRIYRITERIKTPVTLMSWGWKMKIGTNFEPGKQLFYVFRSVDSAVLALHAISVTYILLMH